MRIWCNLIWKEWLGLRWKLIALSAIPTACVALVTAYEPSLLELGLAVGMLGYVAIAPVFLTMHTAARENADGTLEFIRGLPCPRQQIGLVRVIAGIVVLAIPVLAAAVLSYGISALLSYTGVVQSHAVRLFSTDNVASELVDVTAIYLIATISLYLWGSAIAMNQPNELRAGAIAVAVTVGWMTWSVYSVSFWNSWYGMYGVTAMGPIVGPVLLESQLSIPGRIAAAAIHVAAAVALIRVASLRYGALDADSWKQIFNHTRRFSSPGQALFWMQRRQVVPLALAAVVTLILLSSAQDRELTIVAGGVWAIVIATTLFSADLEPQLMAFWRSRPIDVVQWFWVKFAVGACVVLVGIDLPAAAIAQPRGQNDWASLVAFAACVPAMHLAVYGFSVLLACLVRNVIYAGILSMGAMMSLVTLPMIASQSPALVPINVTKVMERFVDAATRGAPGEMLAAVAFYVLFAGVIGTITTLAALWAVRRDVAVRS